MHIQGVGAELDVSVLLRVEHFRLQGVEGQKHLNVYPYKNHSLASGNPAYNREQI